MDWDRIKQNKKAWKLLCEFHDDISENDVGLIDHPEVWATIGWELEFWEVRHLYDFFDKHGIYVHVLKSGLDSWFDPRVSVKGQKEQWGGTGVDNRKAAEEEAFERAFEILNDKLSNDGNQTKIY